MEPASTREMSVGTRDGVQCYSLNHRLFVSAEPPVQKPTRDHDPRQLAHVPFSHDVPASTNQITAPRRRTLPQPPKHLPMGFQGTRKSAIAQRQSTKENYGLVSDGNDHQTTLHRDTFKYIDTFHSKLAYEGEYTPYAASSKQLTTRRSKTSLDEGNMDMEQPHRGNRKLPARVPWDGMDTSSVAGAPLRPDVVLGAAVDNQQFYERNFVQSLRFTNPEISKPKKKETNREDETSGRETVFDRLSNPKKFGVVQRNRFNKKLRETKEDDTINKLIAGTMTITRGDYVKYSTDGSQHEQDVKKRHENNEEDNQIIDFFDKLATPKKHITSTSDTAYDRSLNARRSQWGADKDLVFQWQSGAGGLAHYPASRANEQAGGK